MSSELLSGHRNRDVEGAESSSLGDGLKKKSLKKKSRARRGNRRKSLKENLVLDRDALLGEKLSTFINRLVPDRDALLGEKLSTFINRGASRVSMWGKGKGVLLPILENDRKKILKNCFPSFDRGGGDDDDGFESCPVYHSKVGRVETSQDKLRAYLEMSKDELRKEDYLIMDELIEEISKDVGREDLKISKISKAKISKGDRIDVISLLSWKSIRKSTGIPNSNFLVTADGSNVDVEILKDKYVVICCVFLPLHYRFHQQTIGILWDIFAAASAADCPFQLVIVPKLRPGFDAHLVIEHFFSSVPYSCLALPYDCPITCDNVCYALDLTNPLSFASLIVDPNGTVLQTSCECFSKFGISAFPFTDNGLQSLSNDTELLKCRVDAIYSKTKGVPFHHICPALDELLLCNSSLHLTRADKKATVSVSDLKASYVGLYLCRNGNLIESLAKLHQQCSLQGLQFDILIIPLLSLVPPSYIMDRINLDFSNYDTSSWWQFPYDDSVCRLLCELTDCYTSDELIILPPVGSKRSGELKGKAVITRFGIDAYPFTRASILERNFNRTRKLTLQQLFPNDADRSKNSPLNVSNLQGKNVFIYLDPVYPFCSRLSAYFSKIRVAHPDNVFVYVPPKSHEDLKDLPLKKGCVISRSCFTDVVSILFNNGESINEGTIVAVRNGRMLSRKVQCHLRKDGSFLFAHYLKMEIISDLSKLD